MSLQRIRLQSFPPLPTFRVWFLIPENIFDVQSLKLALCMEIPALKELEICHTRLVLEMDEFELLDQCAIALVHEGDLLIVKSRPASLLVLNTLNEAKFEKPAGVQKRRRLSTSTQESSSSLSTSSDSSSSDSSTESSPSHSELEDRKSRPGHVPLEIKKPQSKSTRHDPQPKFPADVQISPGSRQSLVPPGSGKASTQARNKRRRIKRKFARVSSQQLPSNQSALGKETEVSVQSLSEGAEEPSIQCIPQSLPSTRVLSSCSRLGNGTKNIAVKKTKRSSMPQEVVLNSATLHTASSIHPPHAPTFIAPSERKDLPKNLFVTSVDIEWRTDQGHMRRHDVNNEDEQMPEEPHVVQTLDSNFPQSIEWDAIEKKWDKYSRIEASMTLSLDSIVAWKAFGLDPITLTPQASMLHLGKVILMDVDNLLIQPLNRPGVGPVSFGRTSVDEDCESGAPISLPIKDVWLNEWKLISQQ